MVKSPVGYEVKGLAYPGREADYDANSQMPSGFHNGRTVYYVFGRYPDVPDDDHYPVMDLVLFHGDFLNADHEYVHKNRHITGFGSYGDIMIRDRKEVRSSYALRVDKWRNQQANSHTSPRCRRRMSDWNLAVNWFA